MAMFLAIGLFVLICSSSLQARNIVAPTVALVLIVGSVWIMFLEAKYRKK
jgi:high-affinity Fe2+/Pb2+ permease